ISRSYLHYEPRIRSTNEPSLFLTYTCGVPWQLRRLCRLPRSRARLVRASRLATLGGRPGGPLFCFSRTHSRPAHRPVPRSFRLNVAFRMASRPHLLQLGTFSPPTVCRCVRASICSGIFPLRATLSPRPFCSPASNRRHFRLSRYAQHPCLRSLRPFLCAQPHLP